MRDEHRDQVSIIEIHYYLLLAMNDEENAFHRARENSSAKKIEKRKKLERRKAQFAFSFVSIALLSFFCCLVS